MGVSVLVAFSGLGLAWFLYVKRPELPSRIAEASGGLYTLVLNKYWIDELYSAAIIGPLVALSRVVLWQTIDQKVIDGTVNESAVAARDVSQIIRQQQSGLIRSYAGWIAAGAAAVVAYMVWMGTR
jgi:NADH-quinone oxidoreductase subunit L